MVTLWKYNQIIGYWYFVRSHDISDAEQWQRIFQKDEPEEYFYTSKRKPKFDPIARNRKVLR